MQRFKPLLPQNRFSFRTLCSHHRAFSAQPNYVERNDYDDSQQQILVEGRAKSRAAILNRPSSLNALTTSMVARLKRLYDSWEENSDIGFVLMKGSGRAFCSGGDVVKLYHSLNEGNTEEAEQFFKTLYSFVYLQGTYLKPHVAILDGMTMGCGSGISLSGMFRVVTDKTIFSHPEAQIGFHPDAGASYLLSRLPGYLGEYLALTGDKLNGVEMIACRLATHYTLNARLAWLEERLGKLITDDPSVVEDSLAQYGDLVYPDKNSILHKNVCHLSFSSRSASPIGWNNVCIWNDLFYLPFLWNIQSCCSDYNHSNEWEELVNIELTPSIDIGLPFLVNYQILKA